MRYHNIISWTSSSLSSHTYTGGHHVTTRGRNRRVVYHVIKMGAVCKITRVGVVWVESKEKNRCGLYHVIVVGAVCKVTRVGVAWVGLLGYFPARALSCPSSQY